MAQSCCCYKVGVVCLSAVTQSPHLPPNDRKSDPQMIQRGYHGTLLLNGLWGKVLSPASIKPPQGTSTGWRAEGHPGAGTHLQPSGEHLVSTASVIFSGGLSAHESTPSSGVAVPAPSPGPLLVWIRKAGHRLAQTNDTCLANPRRPKWASAHLLWDGLPCCEQECDEMDIWSTVCWTTLNRVTPAICPLPTRPGPADT